MNATDYLLATFSALDMLTTRYATVVPAAPRQLLLREEAQMFVMTSGVGFLTVFVAMLSLLCSS
jgi:hypothetical protein